MRHIRSNDERLVLGRNILVKAEGIMMERTLTQMTKHAG